MKKKNQNNLKKTCKSTIKKEPDFSRYAASSRNLLVALKLMVLQTPENNVCFLPLSELNLLRNVDANTEESGAAAKSSSLLSNFRGSHTYDHETETIFALPRMQLDFKSIHVQDSDEPSLTGKSV